MEMSTYAAGKKLSHRSIDRKKKRNGSYNIVTQIVFFFEAAVMIYG